jgi:hypothetical protein
MPQAEPLSYKKTGKKNQPTTPSYTRQHTTFSAKHNPWHHVGEVK